MRALALALTVGPALAPAAGAEREALKREAMVEVDRLAPLTQQMVDQIFSYAELGFQEHLTSKYVTGLLERNGFRVERGVAGMPTAWVASYGSGKPVIGFIADLDGIPKASQKPGVAYQAPLVEGAPGHGEGHNAGQAVNVTAALVVKKLMEASKLPGTLRLYPGVAEEQLATKAYLVRAGLLRDVDVMLGAHVDGDFAVDHGASFAGQGLVSVEYTFKGRAAHSAGAPWSGRSALDAVELLDVAWNFRREHLPLAHRSHYVITRGGDQPNVVPSEAAVWYFFRERTYPQIKELYALGTTMAEAAAKLTDTSVSRRVLGVAWPPHFNKVVAEATQKNIEAVGMPAWSDADQALARAVQKLVGAAADGLKAKPLPLEPRTPEGGSDDIGDISWNLPTIYLRFPSNIPSLPGHGWVDAIAMATPIAHKGATAGAKAQALTALDLLTSPELVRQAWDYFRDVQIKEQKYEPLQAPEDQPAIDLNKEKMERFAPQLAKLHFDPTRYKTYLEQLGIGYPTLKE
jgi:aminobenzoyl-glutamate utilization protein B